MNSFINRYVKGFIITSSAKISVQFINICPPPICQVGPLGYAVACEKHTTLY